MCMYESLCACACVRVHVCMCVWCVWCVCVCVCMHVCECVCAVCGRTVDSTVILALGGCLIPRMVAD